MAEIGAWLSQGYDAQMFAGASAVELDAFCERKIRESRMTDCYYASSVAIWKALSEAGVENYVVSANVEALVRNVSSTLGVPPDRVCGARVELEGGRWTEGALDWNCVTASCASSRMRHDGWTNQRESAWRFVGSSVRLQGG